MELAKVYPHNHTGTYERDFRIVASTPTFPSTKAGMKERYLDYSAMQPSQWRRTRTSLGGQGDAHLAQEMRYWQLREYCRDFDRNDIFVGQLFDKACDNVLGTGLTPHPATGDDGLDEEIRDRWLDWSEDPKQCDYSQRHGFSKIEFLNLRHQLVDGDAFNIIRVTDDAKNAALQYHEGDRVTSPDNTYDDIVHGIELDWHTDRVLAYHFTKPEKGRRKQRMRRSPASLDSDFLVRIAANDSQDRPNVLHVFDPKRMTQNRGVSVLAPCFEYVGMFEDVNYARVIQQQVVSAIAAFVTTERDFQYGNRQSGTENDGSTTVNEEIAPGTIHRLRPGEKVQPMASGVPGPDYIQHVRLLVRLIGGCLGMPLELALMDTSDTTFHGYRGVLQMARRGFIRTHHELTTRLHIPLYRRLIPLWFGSSRAATKSKLLLRHSWQVPGFPYVDPKVEAEADKIRLKNLMVSPRRLTAEGGISWDDLQDEIVEDYSSIIKKAKKAAAAMNEGDNDDPDQDPVTWRDLLNLDNPVGQTRKVQLDVGPQPEPAPAGDAGAPPKGAPKGAPKKAP